MGLIPKLGELLDEPTAGYYVHVVRSLANFSQFPQHSSSLVSQPVIGVGNFAIYKVLWHYV